MTIEEKVGNTKDYNQKMPPRLSGTLLPESQLPVDGKIGLGRNFKSTL